MQIVKKFFLGKEANAHEKSYLWNMSAGILNAFQSVVILMVITRTNGVYDAGVFTIAYATANLFLTIGNYGMRSYQVTDASGTYSFNDYLSSRLVTSTIMILASIAYVCYGGFIKGYSIDKVIVVFVICLLKVIDAIEDVFHGRFQQKNRLDVGAKMLTIRLLLTIITFGISLVITKDLLISSVITTGFSFLLFMIFTKKVSPAFINKPFSFDRLKVQQLLYSSFGVFIAAFLSFYIINAPKYAIDTYLTQDIQAYYGFISMPVFVVGLLNNFIYQPILTSLAINWADNKKKRFVHRILCQMLIIVGLTICTLVGGYLLGIPVLSWLYHVDLVPYKSNLMVLLLGGGILAMVGFMTVIMTIIRHQRDLLWCYIIVSAMAYVFSPIFVKAYDITGASWVYTLLVFILMLIIGSMLIFRIKKSMSKQINT